jgi:hypothetical protein
MPERPPHIYYDESVLSGERMMGLEPTTFCMASVQFGSA